MVIAGPISQVVGEKRRGSGAQDQYAPTPSWYRASEYDKNVYKKTNALTRPAYQAGTRDLGIQAR
jgi:hypothetical protein